MGLTNIPKEIHMYVYIMLTKMRNKKIGNGQELVQSNPTFHPQNQKRKKYTHKLIYIHERHILSEPNEKLLPK